MGWHVIGWEVTWQQWHVKTCKTCTYWWICIDHDMHILMNMHRPPAEGNFCNVRKLRRLGQCMGNIDIADGYSFRECVSEQKIYFISSWTLLYWLAVMGLLSYGSKVGHRKFHLSLVENLLETNVREPHPHSIPRGRLNSFPREPFLCKCCKSRYNNFLFYFKKL
jgi:hypothetical protein